jgi:thiamine biosynthesis protein ThiI
LTLQVPSTVCRDIPELRLVGKAVFLVSGGIDSPVAAWLLIRKGVKPIFAYFDNYPLCDQAAEGIAVEAIRKVCTETKTEDSKLLTISHSPDLQEIMSKCPPKFACILSRRIMFRVAQELAIREGCRAIVTGDAIGQKASQTLQNIVAADSVLKQVQVLRPLVGMNKLQIERYAKWIGTYEISIRPGVASCGVPTNNPSTAARRDRLDEIERSLDTQAMVTRAVENARLVKL